jgi:predicted acyltransferase
MVSAVPTYESSVKSRTDGTRLLSLDALRGFDMFWILGADQLVRSFQRVYDCPLTALLKEQMEHVEFSGLHFYDLIYPLFVFMVGMSISYSVPRMVAKQGRGAALKRIAIRSLLLFLLGVLYMGGVGNGFKNIYFAGVLHRIGVAYFFAALSYCFCRNVKVLAATCAGCLLLYWALMTFVPVPGLVSNGSVGGFLPVFQLDFAHLSPPSYAQGKSLAYVLDQAYMPGQKFEGTLLSTLAAIANAMLGVFAGVFIQNQNVAPTRKAVALMVAGFTGVVLGLLWSLQFPIVKLLWTSSYVLVACGYSSILLGLFYLVIDVWGYQRWATPFIWIGTNAITIYLLSAAIGFQKVANRFIGGDITMALGAWADSVRAVVALILVLVVCRFLHQRKLFLRL